MSLLKLGDFTLHSGEKSDWIIDCDALSDEDVEVIAMLMAKAVGPFGGLATPPSHEGSVVFRLIDALTKYAKSENNHIILIVDDVYTTGRSVQSLANDYRGAGLKTKVAVIFSRAERSPGVYAVFQFGG